MKQSEETGNNKYTNFLATQNAIISVKFRNVTLFIYSGYV